MNHMPSPRQSPKLLGSMVTEDGSMVITKEQLARYGDGDADRGRRELRLLLAAQQDGPMLNGPTEKPKSVRMATAADEPAILELLMLDLAANAAHIAPPDEAKIMENIRMGTRQRGGITAVIDVAGKPIAVVILAPMQWWWSNGWFFQEIVNFVHPEHRRSRHVDDLLNFSKWATDQMAAKMGYRFFLLCGVLGAWRVQAKVALYRRKFRLAGSAFVYPAPPMTGN